MKPRRAFLLPTLCLFWLYVIPQFSGVKRTKGPVSRAFLVYRTNTLTDRPCRCPMTYSCSCCEQVRILYQNVWKALCVNFSYRPSGLNVNITLNSDTIKVRTVTTYKPFRMCTRIPGCLFSSICASIIELNQFPRSITACLRNDIFAKKQVWQLTYTCVSISTELPMPIINSTTGDTTMAPPPTMAMSMMPAMPAMMPAMMPATPAMMPATPAMMPATPAMMPAMMPATPAMMPAMMPATPAMMPAMKPATPAMMPAMSAMMTARPTVTSEDFER